VLARPILRRSKSGRCRRHLSKVLERPARFAFWAALLGGLAIAILTPPLKGADERDHFTRAYQLAAGGVVTHQRGGYFGAVLPTGYATEINRITRTLYYDPNHTAFLRELGTRPNGGPGVFVEEGTIASYGPGAYLPYLLPIAVARLVGAPLLVQIYLARLASPA
jgi:hypothetical protein